MRRNDLEDGMILVDNNGNMFEVRKNYILDVEKRVMYRLEDYLDYRLVCNYISDKDEYCFYNRFYKSTDIMKVMSSSRAILWVRERIHWKEDVRFGDRINVMEDKNGWWMNGVFIKVCDETNTIMVAREDGIVCETIEANIRLLDEEYR